MIETALLLAALALVPALRARLFSYALWDQVAEAGARRLPRPLWALLVGLGLLALAALYVRPATSPVFLGQAYALLSRAPFSPEHNPAGFRILTPLVSWLLGLRGDLILVTNLIFAAILLAMAYGYFVARGARAGDALFGAGTLAWSLVTLTTVYYGGYTDSLSYVLLLAMWWARARRPLFYLCFLLGLLNRESVAFLVPWLAFVTWRETRPRWRALPDLALGFGICFALYFLFRARLAASHEVKYSVSFYLAPLVHDPLYWVRRAFPLWGAGLFSVFKLFWVFPVWAAISAWRRGERALVFSMALLVACALAQLLVAFDSSRMLTLAFPVQVIALEHLFRAEGEAFRQGAHRIWFANLFVPQLFTAAGTVEVMLSPLTALAYGAMGGRV